MPYNIRIISTYPPRKCGIGTFSRDLATALENFTGEVGNIRVAAIDKDNEPYSIPVDLKINQYEPDSWDKNAVNILSRAYESLNPTIILLQHEYGLDPDEKGNPAEGKNYVKLAKKFHEGNLITITFLHTVLTNPTAHEKETLQELAEYSDGLVVTTKNAIDILENVYEISNSKIRHIDHGIRMQNPSEHDRLAIKKQYGLEDILLITSFGLMSPDKGIQFSIPAYSSFLRESCTEKQKEHLLYLIAGQCHPEFIRAENGKYYKEYQETIKNILEDSKLRWCKIKELNGINAKEYDIIFLDSFLEEPALLKLYAAANIMILPYLNTQQVSSGILADTMGSGRVPIATKFMYALELINPKSPDKKGIIIGERGILVDAGEDSIEQIARGIDYLTFNKERRLEMESKVYERGYEMKWDNSAWKLLQYIQFIEETKKRVTGRGIEFAREKESKLEL